MYLHSPDSSHDSRDTMDDCHFTDTISKYNLNRIACQ